MTFYPGGSGPGRPQFRFGGPITPVLKWFMIACGAGFGLQFFLMVWSRGQGMTPLVSYLGLNATWFWQGAVYQLATFHFLHGSPSHLLFNLLSLWMFAGELETLWGRRKFILYLVITGIGAGLCQVLFMPHLDVPVIGASGIVYGILLAFGLTYPKRIVLLFFILPVRVIWLVVGMGVIELYTAFSSGEASGIAHFAHLGGMLFGWMFLRWEGWYLNLRNNYYRRKLEKRRNKSGIYVVRGDDDEPPYVH